jgi:hypothetical protein
MGTDELSCGSPPSSYINQTFGKQIILLATCYMLVSCLAYFSTLKMEVTCAFEMRVSVQWTIRHYIPEDRTFPDNKLLGSNNGGKFLGLMSNY